jgi:hypothetical protein
MRYSKDDSKFAGHNLNTAHSYGPVEQTVEVLQTVNKSHYLDALEAYYIGEHNDGNYLLNQAHTSQHIPVFNTLY